LQLESKWVKKVIRYLSSFADYYHSTQRYKNEREVLKVIYDFLGQRGADWHLKMVDNLLLDGKKKEARAFLKIMRESFPDEFQTLLAEGLLLASEEDYQTAIQTLNHSSKILPDAFRPFLEKSRVWLASGKKENAIAILKLAEEKVKTLKDLKQVKNIKQIMETTH
jgi:tetratricopeptide (TPR) repeat protein